VWQELVLDKEQVLQADVAMLNDGDKKLSASGLEDVVASVHKEPLY
jgi:hypothetical protein